MILIMDEYNSYYCLLNHIYLILKKLRTMDLRNQFLIVTLILPLLMYSQEENKITSKFDFIPGEKVVLMMILPMKISETFQCNGIQIAVAK